MNLNEKTFGIAKDIDAEASRVGEFYTSPAGVVYRSLSTHSLVYIAEEHMISLKKAIAIAASIGISIT